VRDERACKKPLPRRPEAFKHPRLTVTSATCGPQANPIRDRARRGVKATSTESANTEWQATRRSQRPKGLPDPPAVPLETRMKPGDAGRQTPRRSRRPQGLPDSPAWPLRNRFAGLPEAIVKEDSAYLQEYPKLPSQPQKTPVISKTTQRRPAVQTQVVSPPESNRSRSTQPYGSSYFLPRKNSGKAATFLLDTGCTTNLLSRRLFDTLGAREQASLEPYEGAHGTLADGSCILFTALLCYLDASMIK